MSSAFANPAIFSSAKSLRRTMGLVGIIGAGISILGLLIDRAGFFTAYLEAYLFVVAFPLGALGLLMVHNLTGGSWGWTIRPFLVAGIETFPWMVVLFIPIVIGMPVLFSWTHPELVQGDPQLMAKVGYLNVKFWIIRAIFYFAIWMLFSRYLKRWMLPGPGRGTLREVHRVQRLSGGGLVVYMLTASFAAFDWVMSVEPHWFSSLFGACIVVGHAMTGFAFATYVAILMHRRSPNPWVTQKNLHDLGKFLFMCVMLWGYVNLGQYLIIWMGNLPEETFWYQLRADGWWQVISFIYVMAQFTVPFFILLSARVKKNADALMKIIPYLLVIRLLEQIWLIAPTLREGRFPLHWLDLVLAIALGGIWAAFYFNSLTASAGIPEPVIVPHSLLSPQDKNMPRPSEH